MVDYQLICLIVGLIFQAIATTVMVLTYIKNNKKK